MSLLILANSSEQKNTSYLDAVKQFTSSIQPVFSIFQIEDIKTTDFEALNRDPATKGGVLFLHAGIAAVRKDEQLSKGRKSTGFDLWFEGSNTSVRELIKLFVYKKPKGKDLYGAKYSPGGPPVVILLLVDKITPDISSIINGALGIDEFGRTLRKVYVVAIPLGPSTTKQQRNKKIEKALQQLAEILKRGFVLSDILTEFQGAKHYAQHEQFDSDDDEATEIRHSLDNALSISIGRIIKSKAKPPPAPAPAPPPARGNGGAMPTPTTEVIQIEDEVNCTVYAPNEVAAGTQFLVQVFAHTAEQQSLLDDLAKSADDSGSRRGSVSLEEKVARETRIDFNLMMPGLEIDEPNLSVKWQGKIASVQFGVEVPSAFTKPDIIGKITVARSSVPVGQLKFKINVMAAGTTLNGDPARNSSTMKRFQQAFISYSSKDRPEVLKRVQMLNLVKLNFFQDLLTLEPGDKWENQIRQYISTCDVFFLFWSKAASESEWVRKEVLYAIARKGANDDSPPEIVPVIIEGPPPAPPPAELNFLHFNDKFMYFINAQR